MKRTKTTRASKSGKPKVSKAHKQKVLDKMWSAKVRARDGACLKCGSISCLNAHHVFGRRHTSTRWDVDNGVTLCMPCHIFWAHRDVGSFAAWFIGREGKNKFDELSNKSMMICQDKTLDYEAIARSLK